ncbi:DUF3592 domain-containing protein [Kitasatospora sp. NA04385]|uniref:DUF3592 domain-containing protein n=1 Tax=Kitasatospora sp. NA04385 TaxID=2742135 RepID=UPI0015921107|nr:DUF3592 domain-containing protein [Kitasatospora sp. NA04385]QKW22854.1 DUF3592 domain-containing protein [Kitasatospora sp. NA04385]
MADTAMLVAGLITGPAGLAVLGAGLPGALLRGRRWASEGVTAEARCLETFVSQPHGDDRASQRHAIVEFRTPDGTAHRAKLAARTLVVGDRLTVRYRPRKPENAVHADQSVGTAALVVVCLVFGAALLTVAAITLSTGLQPDPEPTDTWHLVGH